MKHMWDRGTRLGDLGWAWGIFLETGPSGRGSEFRTQGLYPTSNPLRTLREQTAPLLPSQARMQLACLVLGWGAEPACVPRGGCYCWACWPQFLLLQGTQGPPRAKTPNPLPALGCL